MWRKFLNWLMAEVPVDPDGPYSIRYMAPGGLLVFTYFGERRKPMNTFRFPVEDKDFVKSSDSQPGGIINCVEVARKPEGVAVRNSKDPSKNTVFFTSDEWRAFLNGASKGEFDI